MLTELELCEKRRHKALIRGRRGRHSQSAMCCRTPVGQHPETWVMAEASKAMQASLLTVLFANVRSFFTPRRGR